MTLPPPAESDAIEFGARRAHRWTAGDYEVWWLEGDSYIRQGAASARGEQAVLWIKHGGEFADREHLVIAYFEGAVRVVNDDAARPLKIEDRTWLGDFRSTAPIEARTPAPAGEPETEPAIYLNGMARRMAPLNNPIRQTQFAETLPSPAEQPMLGGVRRVRIQPRSDIPFNIKWFPSPTRDEWIAMVTSGVNIVVEGIPQLNAIEGGDIIDMSADRMVIWTRGVDQPGLLTEQNEDTPLEIYMEGNIEVHQGERVIYADRMYYDVRNQLGTILNAELLTPVPQYMGLLRMRADVLQQTAPNRFFGQNMFITSSRLASPGYRLQTSEVFFEDDEVPQINPFTGAPVVDPITGEPVVVHERFATSQNNTLFLGPAPVFYWPVLATDLEDPTYYIRRLQIKNDQIFGTQVLSQWDIYQLLGIRNEPEGTDWGLNLDYLSDRGFGYGSTFTYNREDFFGIEGPTTGFVDAWAIDDKGFDRLGGDRFDLTPEEDYRYRILSRHRQQLGEFQFTAEVGKISDRNFLEQYYENEWDQFKDQSTGIELKHLRDNRSASLQADVRVNDFFTETEWLPRLDHYWLGQPLLGDTLSWYEHTSVGYARLRTASTPLDPQDASKFNLLPWEADVEGERLVTRQELDLPVQLGPFKIVPYALGEIGQWGETLTDENVSRAYGQAGVRASIPFWTVNPNVENTLFNVHGLAHKVVFDVDAFVADANKNMSDFPLYDPLDDNAQEHFRRRFAFNTFGGITPPQFDERSYALRSGMGSWVTSPSYEIADDLAAVRMGARQRLQTKRGLPGQRRIIDWMVLDTGATIFPEEDRDNFGEMLGLVDYDFRWHLGDRVTLVSSGAFDFFPDGQETITVGGFLNKPPRGSLYLGYHSLGGPIDSQVVIGSYTYRLSPKWASTAGASVDVSGDGNIGNQFSLTRIGESLLVSLGVTVDENKDNFGVNFMVQPRFLPTSGIPPAGIFGLE